MTLEVHLFTWMFGMAALWAMGQPDMSNGWLIIITALVFGHVWVLYETRDQQPCIAPRSVYP